MTAISQGDRMVVQVRTRAVEGHTHVSAVVLNDDTIVASAEVIRQMREYGKRYRRVGDRGATLRAGRCPDCGDTVLL